MNTFLFFRCWNTMFIFYYYLVEEYKYGQYCTPLSQSDCRYFFVLAITIYKSVLRSHLNYGDVVYDCALKEVWYNKKY